MLPDMKHIILADMNVKLYSWPLTMAYDAQNALVASEPRQVSSTHDLKLYSP